VPAQIDAAARIGVQTCEIHTGPYAHAFHAFGRDAVSPKVAQELALIAAAGKQVLGLGMRFNAGHALNYNNIKPVASLAGVSELHIGHAIIARALFVGVRTAVREMKGLIEAASKN
jgi:pyridoxine 5-phosphate synthase